MEPIDIETMREQGKKMQMILKYAYYLIKADIDQSEEGVLKQRSLKLFMETFNFTFSINSIPDNFYEENRNVIDALYLRESVKWQQILLNELIEEAEQKIKKEEEISEIRDAILENERKKELRNEVYKHLVDEGHIKRNIFDSETKREPIPQDVMDKVWNRDSGKCVKCGSQENLEFDHIIPHSKGGATSYRNIQILCKKCNIEKSNKIG